MKNIIEKIYDYSLEEIMGERFGRYSKYIIQDRAIPDVRDGLKPVQRRILYAMHMGKNTYDRAYKKSAKTVGDVIGSYHPHGDTSIYDAMVRMSQDWKMREPYIDMHGNNGSIDGDSPAAYRYTEARLAKIAGELLSDIDKNTVKFSPNFDDSTLEPTVLPAKFPNLLVNGATGISAGYATSIPPHNLGEVLDAAVKRIDSPDSREDTILKIIKGPDFPTGGIICGTDGIDEANKTGKGRIIVRGRMHREDTKTKKVLVFTEIPYEVVKTNIIRKIDEIRIDKILNGLLEVRDESDKDGLRIVIELKKDANEELILNYLYKNTELQSSFNYNMVAIVNRRPKLLSVIKILDSYIAHLKEVVLNRTEFDLRVCEKRFHIVEGLIKAISILDEVIKTIRKSKNKLDAKNNLVSEFDFTMEQAEAIVTLQLYRLSNTDIGLLKEELENLRIKLEALKKILEEPEALKYVMKKELKMIKNEYATDRKTDIAEEVSEIKIDLKEMIPKEDVIVLVTKEGYVKRTSKRSYDESEDPLLKEGDYPIGLFEQNTLDVLLMFTSLGNYLYVPVNDIPDIKWKQLGKHISNLVKLSENEEIVSAIAVSNFDSEKSVVIGSANGMIKRSLLSDFEVTRYSKPMKCINLKNDDELIYADIEKGNEIFIATNDCYGVRYNLDEVPISGIKSLGVKSMNVKDGKVISICNFDNEIEYFTIFTDKSTAKRIKLNEIEITSRGKRGVLLLRKVKTNPYNLIKVLTLVNKEEIGLKIGMDLEKIKNTDIPILDRNSTGTSIAKGDILEVFKIKTLKSNKKVIKEVIQEEDNQIKQISLLDIDERLKNVDNILK